jgi:hypothetical protein
MVKAQAQVMGGLAPLKREGSLGAPTGLEGMSAPDMLAVASNARLEASRLLRWASAVEREALGKLDRKVTDR